MVTGVQTCALPISCVSTARKETVCDPSERPLYAFGSVQETNTPASSLHSNVAVPSVSEKPNETFLPLVEAAAGPLSMLGTGGATASTVHVRDVAPETLPYASSARTEKVCEPSARLV